MGSPIHPRPAHPPASEAPGPHDATLVFWVLVAGISVFGAIVPGCNVAATYCTGYFGEDDSLIPALFSTFLVIGCVALFAVANGVWRSGMRWRIFPLAIALQLASVGIGQAIVAVTSNFVVRRSVERAQEVVDAVHAFERSRGHAPTQLAELVPEFLHGDPERVFTLGPGIHYEPTTDALPVPTGAWRVPGHFIEHVNLEYAPAPGGRAPTTGERRIGDWLVKSRFNKSTFL